MTQNGIPPESSSPIVYPTVTIQGVQYQVRWSNRCLYRLDAMGCDLAEIAAQLLTGRIRIKALMDLLAACIERKPRFDPEELSDMIPIADHKLMAEALRESMGKVSPPPETKLREPAASTPDPQLQ